MLHSNSTFLKCAVGDQYHALAAYMNCMGKAGKPPRAPIVTFNNHLLLQLNALKDDKVKNMWQNIFSETIFRRWFSNSGSTHQIRLACLKQTFSNFWIFSVIFYVLAHFTKETGTTHKVLLHKNLAMSFNVKWWSSGIVKLQSQERIENDFFMHGSVSWLDSVLPQNVVVYKCDDIQKMKWKSTALRKKQLHRMDKMQNVCILQNVCIVFYLDNNMPKVELSTCFILITVKFWTFHFLQNGKMGPKLHQNWNL